MRDHSKHDPTPFIRIANPHFPALRPRLGTRESHPHLVRMFGSRITSSVLHSTPVVTHPTPSVLHPSSGKSGPWTLEVWERVRSAQSAATGRQGRCTSTRASMGNSNGGFVISTNYDGPFHSGLVISISCGALCSLRFHYLRYVVFFGAASFTCTPRPLGLGHSKITT